MKCDICGDRIYEPNCNVCIACVDRAGELNDEYYLAVKKLTIVRCGIEVLSQITPLPETPVDDEIREAFRHLVAARDILEPKVVTDGQ